MRCYTALEYQPARSRDRGSGGTHTLAGQAGGSRALLRVAAWAGLVMCAAFFLTTGGTYPGIASVEGHIIGQAIAIVVFGGWFAISLMRPSWRARTPLLVPVVLACLAYVASGLVSQRPRLSLEPTIAGIGWAVAFLFLSRLLADRWFRARVAAVMTAFVTVVAVGYLIQVAIEWMSWWNLIGRFAIPPLRPSFAALFLGSPNLIATALLLLGPLVVTIAWGEYRRRALAVALALVSLAAIFVSGSRGAWFGAAVGVVVAIGLVVARLSLRHTLRELRQAFGRRPVLLVPVVAVGLAGLVFVPSVLQRFGQGGEGLRLDLWRSALSIFAAHPVFGAGPGTWVQLKVAANPVGVPNLSLPHAHDTYVQAAAELGIVGLVALLVLVVAVVLRFRQGFRATTDDHAAPTLSLEAAAVIVSAAAIAGQSLVDNFSNLPFVCLIVVSLVAWVDGRLSEREAERAEAAGSTLRGISWRIAKSRVLAAAGLVAIALAFPTLLRVDGAAIQSQSGNDDARRGDWGLALLKYDLARQADPGFTLYELQAASALARLGRTEEARAILAGAVESDRVAINLIGLAALEAERGSQEAARALASDAMGLGYGESTIALNAGLIAERFGDDATALDRYANAIAWNPPVAESDFWSEAARLVPKQVVVDTAVRRTDPFVAALIRAYAGDAPAAQAALAAMPVSPTRDAYVAAVLGVSGDTLASLAKFDALLQANPSDWFAAALAARIAHRASNEIAAARYARWAVTVQGDSAPGVFSEALLPASADDPWAGLPSTYPWSTYLRPDTPFLTIVDLTAIGIR